MSVSFHENFHKITEYIQESESKAINKTVGVFMENWKSITHQI